MLSLTRCRQILGPGCQMPDDQIELLRDQLVGLAAVVIDSFGDKLRIGGEGAFGFSLRLIPDEQRGAIIERAAIMEADGQMTRARAETEALKNWECVPPEEQSPPDASKNPSHTNVAGREPELGGETGIQRSNHYRSPHRLKRRGSRRKAHQEFEG